MTYIKIIFIFEHGLENIVQNMSMQENLQNPETNAMKRVNTLPFELPSGALGPVGRLGPQSIVIGPAIETVLTEDFCF